MFAILFTIVLSGIPYHVTNNCKELGGTYFPKNDSKEIRILNVCADYGPSQTRQIVEHELFHICLHSHKHTYKTQEELDNHLYMQTYTEEYFAHQEAPCIIENRDKLFVALEHHGIHL